MARTDLERYTGAVQYIQNNVNRDLAQEIARKVGNKTAAGAALSLKGGGFWRSGSDNQHWAVRGLMLCQHVFLKGVQANQFVSATQNLADTTRHFHGKSETVVKEAIKSYVADTAPSRNKLVTTATTTNATAGDFKFTTRLRTDQSMGANPICFNAVRLWLFNSGFVSLKWLASDGYLLDANTCNRILGDGTVIRPDQLATMPAGYMFNFHAAASKAVCHWGITLGNGWAAGSNTTSEARGAKAPVNFRKGNSVYGEFELATSYEVCRYKYARPEDDPETATVIRQIDPTAVRGYF